MKRLQFFFSILMLSVFQPSHSADLRDIKQRKIVESLPKAAQEFVKLHFKDYKFSKVSKIKKTFCLYFDGVGLIEFDKNGNWMYIDGFGYRLPFSIISEEIFLHIRQDYPISTCGRLERNGEYIHVYLCQPAIKLCYDIHNNYISTELCERY